VFFPSPDELCLVTRTFQRNLQQIKLSHFQAHPRNTDMKSRGTPATNTSEVSAEQHSHYRLLAGTLEEHSSATAAFTNRRFWGRKELHW